jgi:glycerate kinase
LTKFGRGIPNEQPETTLRVVVAPDKFKGCLTAAEVAAALAKGLHDVVPNLDVVQLPIADGGDGTVEVALQAGFRRVAVTASGPTGKPVRTAFAIRDDTAVVELADVVGLRRLGSGPREALVASSYGLGEVLTSVLDHGVSRLVLGLGGSASTDGGAGMVEALGVRLEDEHGATLGRGANALLRLARIDVSHLDSRMQRVRVDAACDVDNPLLGRRGAARVFAPQKGADPQQVEQLERAIAVWASKTRHAVGADFSRVPGSGAAGGVGFAALAYLGARLVSGIDLVLELVGFAEAVAGADLVITGEGSLDPQTLSGKGPLGVAQAARLRGVPVVAVAGRVSLSPHGIEAAGFSRAYSLRSLEPDLERSLAMAAPLLTRIAKQIGKELLNRGS